MTPAEFAAFVARADADARSVVELRRRIAELEAENADLHERQRVLLGPTWVHDGLAGEVIVARAVGGTLTRPNARYDVLTPSLVRLEVKLATPSRPVRTAPTLRWNWNTLFGHDGLKEFDRLILVGLADDRYRHSYADPSSPFVCFDIPFAEVRALMCPRAHGIQLTTNPGVQRTPAGRRLFSEFQVPMSALEATYERLEATQEVAAVRKRQ